ncbi:unnamed protein product, partial [Vitis vinifera]|uniref:Uncharacterized protein n=1 Tax=Vitis vinifera TaxID=29760 RepID=D7TL87_VITVI
MTMVKLLLLKSSQNSPRLIGKLQNPIHRALDLKISVRQGGWPNTELILTDQGRSLITSSVPILS